VKRRSWERVDVLQGLRGKKNGLPLLQWQTLPIEKEELSYEIVKTVSER